MELDRSILTEIPLLNNDVYKWFDEFPIYMRQDELKWHNFKLHVQPGIELNLTLEGQAAYVVDNHILRQSPGDLLIFPGKLPHQVFVDRTETYRRIVLLIDDQNLSSLLTSQHFYWFTDISCSHIRLQPETFLEVKALLSQMFEEMTERNLGWKQVIISGLLHLAVIVRRSMVDKQHANNEGLTSSHTISDDLIARISNYIAQNLHEELSLKQIAHSFHISPDHLIRIFKKEKGLTFHQYVLLQRVLESKRLLVNHPELSLTEIALAAGFTSSSQFSKTFKSFNGHTPSQFRELSQRAVK